MGEGRRRKDKGGKDKCGGEEGGTGVRAEIDSFAPSKTVFGGVKVTCRCGPIVRM